MLDFNHMTYLNVTLLLFSALVTTFLLFGALMSRIRNRVFLYKVSALLVAQILMQLGEAGIWYWNGSLAKAWLIKLCCFFSFGMGLVMTVLFIQCFEELLQRKGKVHKLPLYTISALCGVGFLLVGASVFNGIFFTVDASGYFANGPYAEIVSYIDFINFIIMLGMALFYRKLLTIRGFSMLLVYCALHLGALLLENIWYPIPLYLASTLALVAIFNFFHEALEDEYIKKEKELLESRIALMVSQIQPHFLYNSLNSIYHLCDMDAKLAQEATGNFSEYLQHVLGSLKRTTPIMFEQELKNVQAYLELEKLRFDDVKIVYDIRATNFFVPALSVQPLVENAVKHGLCAKEEGGTLLLATREKEDCFEIIVQDDGVGFAKNKLKDDGGSHLGVQNVKQRLEAMVGGSLTITSALGVGTTAIISLPKEKER